MVNKIYWRNFFVGGRSCLLLLGTSSRLTWLRGGKSCLVLLCVFCSQLGVGCSRLIHPENVPTNKRVPGIVCDTLSIWNGFQFICRRLRSVLPEEGWSSVVLCKWRTGGFYLLEYLFYLSNWCPQAEVQRTIKKPKHFSYVNFCSHKKQPWKGCISQTMKGFGSCKLKTGSKFINQDFPHST